MARKAAVERKVKVDRHGILHSVRTVQSPVWLVRRGPLHDLCGRDYQCGGIHGRMEGGRVAPKYGGVLA